MSFICYFFCSGYYPTEVCTTTILFSVTKVMEKYLVPDYASVQEFLAHLGKRLGKLKKGKLFGQRKRKERKFAYIGPVIQSILAICSCISPSYKFIRYPLSLKF